MMAITTGMGTRFFKSPAELMTVLALVVGLMGASSANAGAQPHMLQASNAIGNPNLIGNPDFLIGFDAPQADGALVPAVLNLDNPSAPTFTISGVENGASPQLFDLVFDVNLPLTYNLPRISSTDTFQSLSFSANDATGAAVLDVSFSFSTASGGSVTGFSASAFNPQPDIPGFGAGIEMKFNETSLSGVTLTMNVQDANGNPLMFAPVPEPETYAMLLAGLGMLGFFCRRRKQNDASA